MVKKFQESKFIEEPWKGPFYIVKVNANGTVCLTLGNVTDIVNIQ